MSTSPAASPTSTPRSRRPSYASAPPADSDTLYHTSLRISLADRDLWDRLADLETVSRGVYVSRAALVRILLRERAQRMGVAVG